MTQTQCSVPKCYVRSFSSLLKGMAAVRAMLTDIAICFDNEKKATNVTFVVVRENQKLLFSDNMVFELKPNPLPEIFVFKTSLSENEVREMIHRAQRSIRLQIKTLNKESRPCV